LEVWTTKRIVGIWTGVIVGIAASALLAIAALFIKNVVDKNTSYILTGKNQNLVIVFKVWEL